MKIAHLRVRKPTLIERFNKLKDQIDNLSEVRLKLDLEQYQKYTKPLIL